MVAHTQIAYTEPGQPEPGEYVRFFNVTLEADGTARITLRDNLGQSTWMEVSQDVWRSLAARIAEATPDIKHDYWMPGDPDCPSDIKAGNGELARLRCKRCGMDAGRPKFCTFIPPLETTTNA